MTTTCDSLVRKTIGLLVQTLARERHFSSCRDKTSRPQFVARLKRLPVISAAFPHAIAELSVQVRRLRMCPTVDTRLTSMPLLAVALAGKVDYLRLK